ncbi:MAG: Fe-S protein assembly co-chaperone HscB [Magnetococcus sp. DMHC-6]
MPPPRPCWSCQGLAKESTFCTTCGLIQPPDPKENFFQIFNLPPSFTIDKQKLAADYREAQQRFHPDRFATRSARERRFSLEHVTRLNAAYQALNDSLNRAILLLSLYAPTPPPSPPSDPEFLMEMMELREELELIDLRSPSTAEAQLNNQRQAANARIATQEALLSAGFARLARQTDRLRYHRRFLEELDRMEEQLY